MRQHLRDVLAAEQDAALIRRLEARQQSQQRGLAAAARSQQREKLAGPDIERQPVHRPHGAEAFLHRLDAQQRHVGRHRLRLGLCRLRGSRDLWYFLSHFPAGPTMVAS